MPSNPVTLAIQDHDEELPPIEALMEERDDKKPLEGYNEADHKGPVPCSMDIEDSFLESVPIVVSTLSDNSRTNRFEEKESNTILVASICTIQISPNWSIYLCILEEGSIYDKMPWILFTLEFISCCSRLRLKFRERLFIDE